MNARKRFVLLSSVASVAVIGMVLGGMWILPRVLAYQQARASTQIRKLGGTVDGSSGDRYPEIGGAFRCCSVDLTRATFSDDDLALVDGLLAAVDLDLSGTGVTDRGVEVLSQLRYSKIYSLNLSGTKITDKVFTYLEKMPNLCELNLSRTGITDKELPRLESMKDMRHINLSGTMVDDEGVPSIVKVLKSSGIGKELDLSGTAITDASLTNLAGLDFDHLDLSKTSITNDGLMSLAENCPYVNILYVSNTRITDAGLHALKHTKGLGRLDVTGSHVTVAGVQELRKAVPGLDVVGP